MYLHVDAYAPLYYGVGGGDGIQSTSNKYSATSNKLKGNLSVSKLYKINQLKHWQRR